MQQDCDPRTATNLQTNVWKRKNQGVTMAHSKSRPEPAWNAMVGPYESWSNCLNLFTACASVNVYLFLLGSFKRRKRKSIIVTVMLLIVSVLILIFGLAATTRTQNITVGGYYSGVIVSTHSHRRVLSTDAAQQACSLLGCMISEVAVLPAHSPLLSSPDEPHHRRSWAVNITHIYYLASLSLSTEWGNMFQSLNLFVTLLGF